MTRRRNPVSTFVERSALAAALLLLASCSVWDWMFKTENPATKPVELTEIKDALGVQATWRLSVGSGKGLYLQPAVLENAVYVASADGALSRLAPATGQVVWRSEVGGRIGAGVGSDGQTVAVVTVRGEVLAYDAEGKSVWRAQAPSDVASAPLVGRGLVVVRSTDHRISAFEADSGKRRWQYVRSAPPLALRGAPELIFAGDNVLAGFPGGRLVALALTNGAPRWEVTVSEPKGTTEVERLADVVGAIAVSGGDACAASYQGRAMCANFSNGNVRWSREFLASAGVARDATRLYGVDNKAHVAAFMAESGANLWRNEQLTNRGLTSPAATTRAVAAGDAFGYMHYFALNDGVLVGRTRVDDSPIVATPRRWADGLIVQTQGGTVALLTAAR
jgi:outer membrane protein assembly factor BamB